MNFWSVLLIFIAGALAGYGVGFSRGKNRSIIILNALAQEFKKAAEQIKQKQKEELEKHGETNRVVSSGDQSRRETD